MKRIISLLLCLILACGMLVGCGEGEIGEHLSELEQFRVEPEEKIALKLYIVYDEADEGARTEVERRINALTEADYNTNLDVVYLKADEYDAKVMAAAQAGEQAIVLINSVELMMKLYGNGEDVTITEMYDPKLATAEAPVVKVVTKHSANGSSVTKYDAKGNVVAGTENDDKKIPISKQITVGYLEEVGGYILPQETGDAKYGLLNAKISSSLIEASKIAYSVLDKNGNVIEIDKTYLHDDSTVVDENGAAVKIPQTALGLFSVPNNHLIDGTDAYTYLQIDRQACEIWLNHSVEYLRNITSIEQMNALKAELVALLGEENAAKADDYLKLVRGSFADKARVEAGEKFIMNVIVAPQVTAEDAFAGAFAVLKGTDVDRAMRIIYAINMNSDFRNLLQYGIKDTNYSVTDNVVTRFGDTEDNRYEGKKYFMNLLYTGSVFKIGTVYNALYCADENWTADVATYIEAQNKVANEEYSQSVADALVFEKAADKAEKLQLELEGLVADADAKVADAVAKEAIAEEKKAAAEAAGNADNALNAAALEAINAAKTARTEADEAVEAAEAAKAAADLAVAEFDVIKFSALVAELEIDVAVKTAIAHESADEAADAEALAAAVALENAKVELEAAKEALETLKNPA